MKNRSFIFYTIGQIYVNAPAKNIKAEEDAISREIL
jgi:hypothetical protein